MNKYRSGIFRVLEDGKAESELNVSPSGVSEFTKAVESPADAEKFKKSEIKIL